VIDMDSVTAYKGRTYEEDYNEICRLEAAVGVLEKKKNDYRRIAQGAENDFNEACKKLAEYQLIQDELNHFTWRKIKAKLTFKFNKEYETNNNSLETTKRNLENIKYRMQDAKGKANEVFKDYEKAKKDYNEQRAYMRRVYTEFNGYEQNINAQKVKLQAVIKEIDEAIAAVDEVIEIAKCALDKFKSAKTLGVVDMIFNDSFLVDIAKYNKINNAESMVYTLNAAVARMNKELHDVNSMYTVYCQEFSSGMKFVDVMFDNFFVDAAVLSKINNNISSLNQFLSNVRNVRENLLLNRKEVMREMT
jgi:hypothetical protein